MESAQSDCKLRWLRWPRQQGIVETLSWFPVVLTEKYKVQVQEYFVMEGTCRIDAKDSTAGNSNTAHMLEDRSLVRK